MRILVVGSSQGRGGTQTHFRLLIDFLVAEGHELLIVGIGDDPADLPKVPPTHLVLRLPHSALNLPAKVAKGTQFLKIQRSIAGFKPQLFIAAALGDAYARLAQGLRPPTFRFYQEVIHNPPPGDPLRLRLVEAFDGIAVQSPAMRTPYLTNIRPIKPVGCLPCFSFSPVPGFRAEAPSGDDPLRFAYFGRLADNKGIPQFLRAFAQVQNQVHATFDIHGGGPASELIQQTAKDLDLEASVKLCGPYPGGEDYARLLSSYHALVLPSIDAEGLPLVLLEAMSYGLPYLATTIGAIADSAKDNPDVLVVEPTQAALADGIVAISSRLRAGLTDPARLQTYYQEHYSFAVMAQEWRTMLADPPAYFARQA